MMVLSCAFRKSRSRPRSFRYIQGEKNLTRVARAHGAERLLDLAKLAAEWQERQRNELQVLPSKGDTDDRHGQQ